jgi:hypothetical protein
MLAREEGWVQRASMKAAMQWVDDLIVREHPKGEPWNETTFRQELLDEARRQGGTHFAAIDADEIAETPEQLRHEIEALSPGEGLRPRWKHLWRSLNQSRVDGIFGRSAKVSFAWCDGPNYSNAMMMHQRVPSGVRLREGRSIVLHLQHVVWKRCEAKQVFYQMDELLRWPGHRQISEVKGQYEKTLNESGLETEPFEDWPVDPKLIDVDAEPWQAREVERLLSEHGRERFAGLDLRGF